MDTATLRSWIFILEDDAGRTSLMGDLLATNLGQYKTVFINNAPMSIEWLRQHMAEVALICLDHDLGPNHVSKEGTFDPGTGRDVVNHLVKQEPTCPVIVHSTNSPSAYGMKAALRESGWKCSRVVPFADLEWIEAAWLPRVRKHLARKIVGTGQFCSGIPDLGSNKKYLEDFGIV